MRYLQDYCARKLQSSAVIAMSLVNVKLDDVAGNNEGTKLQRPNPPQLPQAFSANNQDKNRLGLQRLYVSFRGEIILWIGKQSQG